MTASESRINDFKHNRLRSAQKIVLGVSVSSTKAVFGWLASLAFEIYPPGRTALRHTLELMSAKLELQRAEIEAASPTNRSVRKEASGLRLNLSKLLMAFEEETDDVDAYIRDLKASFQAQVG